MAVDAPREYYTFTDDHTPTSNTQPNGANPNHDFNSDAYHQLGASFDDLDSAALLESLSEYNNASSAVNDHFASLLQAAATAGGQETEPLSRSQERGVSPTPAVSASNNTEFFQRSFPPEQPKKPKRKRVYMDDGRQIFVEVDQQAFGLIQGPKKRKRDRTPPPDDPETIARHNAIWGPPEGETDDGDDDASAIFGQATVTTADARKAGVHSAAALFRRPTEASKKYTRPPMSKLFMSMDLEPEEFLQLQSAAKEYMLDKNHPERINCVGYKAKGENDMTKLRLYECVKNFLTDEGWGERSFGVNSPGYEQRRHRWPKDHHKIITVVTPLMRRMVTNERQRLYAMETRIEKKKGNEGSGSENPQGKRRKGARNTTSPSLDQVDPSLNQYTYPVDPLFTPGLRSTTAQAGTTIASPFSLDRAVNVAYHVHLLHNGRRTKPKDTLQPSRCPSFGSLQGWIKLQAAGNMQVKAIKILTADGLVEVKDEDGWREIVPAVGQLEWMDGEVKILVDLEEKVPPTVVGDPSENGGLGP